jgi:hypothetical protein
MKRYARIQSKVLTTALNNEHIKDFGVLSMYLQWFDKDGDCIISDYEITGENEGRIGLKDALSDYFFNERESEGLWELAEKLLGKKIIDMKVIKIVSI